LKSGLFEGDQQYDDGCDNKWQQKKQPLGAQPAHELRFILAALRLRSRYIALFSLSLMFTVSSFRRLSAP